MRRVLLLILASTCAHLAILWVPIGGLSFAKRSEILWVSSPTVFFPAVVPTANSRNQKSRVIAPARASNIAGPVESRAPATSFSDKSASWQSMSFADAVTASGNSPPVYPEQARRFGWESAFSILLELDAEGRVRDVSAQPMPEHRVFFDAVRRSALTWAFPQKFALARIRVPVVFRLAAD